MTAAWRAIRLALGMQRWEVLLLGLGALLLVLMVLAIAWQMRVIRTDELACYTAAPPTIEGSISKPCPQFEGPSTVVSTLQRGMGLPLLAVPVVLGLFLGLPIVARELEQGTAPIAWTLSRSRARWLLYRAAPVVVLAVVLSAAVAVAAEVMWRASPWAEGLPHLGFAEHGTHGPLLVARGLTVLGIGLAAGAFVGRQLGGLLLAVLLSAAVLVGVAMVMDAWMESEAEWIDVATPGDSRIFDMAYRVEATGEVIGFDEFYAYNGGQIAVAEGGEPEGMTPIARAVPAARAGDFTARESGVLAALTAVAVAVAGVTVRYRRPR